MRVKKIFISFFLALALLLSGCTPPLETPDNTLPPEEDIVTYTLTVDDIEIKAGEEAKALNPALIASDSSDISVAVITYSCEETGKLIFNGNNVSAPATADGAVYDVTAVAKLSGEIIAAVVFSVTVIAAAEPIEPKPEPVIYTLLVSYISITAGEAPYALNPSLTASDLSSVDEAVITYECAEEHIGICPLEFSAGNVSANADASSATHSVTATATLNDTIVATADFSVEVTEKQSKPEPADFIENNFTQEFLDFFSLENKLAIEIVISSSELAKIQSDYDYYKSKVSKSPIYRICDLVITTPFNTYTIPEVGIRMKGNTSLRDFYDTDGVFNLINYKLSFQQTFDDEAYYGEDAKVWDKTERAARKSRTFLGMSKLDMKWNKNYDSTFIKDAYVNKFYRDAGLLAPFVTVAETKLNFGGDSKGVGIYTVMETIDENFLEKRIVEAERGGDLYSLGYSGSYCANFIDSAVNNWNIGVDDDILDTVHAYDLKTNKKTSDHSKLVNLINFFKGSRQTIESGIENFIDMDYFTKLEAANYFAGNPDDLRNNYNNFYVYFLKTTGKMIIIPYDCDRVFGINRDWNPSGNGMTMFEPFTRQRGAGGNQSNPLYTNTIIKGGINKYIMMYREYLLELKDMENLTSAEFEKHYRFAYSNYNMSVRPEIPKIGDQYVSFSNAVQSNIRGNDNIDFTTYISLKKQTLMNSINNYNS